MSDLLPVVTVTFSPGHHLERFLASLAMATERAMLAAGDTVTAAAPLSGPYALEAFGDARIDHRRRRLQLHDVPGDV